MIASTAVPPTVAEMDVPPSFDGSGNEDALACVDGPIFWPNRTNMEPCAIFALGKPADAKLAAFTGPPVIFGCAWTRPANNKTQRILTTKCHLAFRWINNVRPLDLNLSTCGA